MKEKNISECMGPGTYKYIGHGGYFSKLCHIILIYKKYEEYFDSIHIRNTRGFPNLRLEIYESYKTKILSHETKILKNLPEQNLREIEIKCHNFTDMVYTASRLCDDIIFNSIKVTVNLFGRDISHFHPLPKEINSVLIDEQKKNNEHDFCPKCVKVQKLNNEIKDFYLRPVINAIRKREEKKKQTYLIFDGNLYKIGRSCDPDNRLKDLQASNPSCKLLHIINNDIEHELHIKYKDKHIHHEWFNLDQEDVLEITSINYEKGISE